MMVVDRIKLSGRIGKATQPKSLSFPPGRLQDRSLLTFYPFLPKGRKKKEKHHS
jgi:hypothetical protein